MTVFAQAESPACRPGPIFEPGLTSPVENPEELTLETRKSVIEGEARHSNFLDTYDPGRAEGARRKQSGDGDGNGYEDQLG
jgi:hypothetical protein